MKLQRLLAELVGRRRQIIEMLVAERQREKRAANARVRKSLARHIAALENELPEIDGDIGIAGPRLPVWREKEDLLVSCPGVGHKLARTCWPRCPNWEHSTDVTSPA